jgi:hypothetical protein
MNKKLYEALFFKLRADIMNTSAQLDRLFLETQGLEEDTLVVAQQLVMNLVQLQGALHTLQEEYAGPFNQSTDVEGERWKALFLSLERLENYANPSYEPLRSTPLTHEELLERSSDYRKSQNLGYTLRKREDEDEE